MKSLTTEFCNQNIIIFGDFNIYVKSTGAIRNLLQETFFSSLLGVEY